MTNQDAIGIIEDLEKALEDNGIISQAPEIKEALTMSIEALKRSQGEWLKITSRIYKCSECGRNIHSCDADLGYYPFCHCGAKMKGGKE